MIENQIGKRFAEALSHAVTDNAKLGATLGNLQAFRDAFAANPELARFFIHPAISDEKKQALVKELCDQFQVGPEIRNLLAMLVERQKIRFIRNITDYFEATVDRRLNQVRINVVSADPLSQGSLDQLKTSLSRILGKTPLIETQVDPTLLAGVRLSIGSLVADATVKNRLAQLQRSIEQEEVFSEIASG